MSTRSAAEVGRALTQLTPINHMFCERLRTKVPGMSEGKLKIAVYVIDAALISTVQYTGILDDVSEGEFNVDKINELIGRVSQFFAGGLRALA